MAFTVRNRIAVEITFNNGAPTELTCEFKRGSAASELYALGSPEIIDAGQGVYRYAFVPGDDGDATYSYRWYGKDSQGVEFAMPKDGPNRYKTFRVY